jgi:hypothetical protein
VACLAQDLTKHIDAEGTSVAAADAEDRSRPTAAGRVSHRMARRLLTDPPVAVAEGGREPRLAELSEVGGSGADCSHSGRIAGGTRPPHALLLCGAGWVAARLGARDPA